MTAEIAVMNREAIALAADSAVTLREEQGQKIFTSANKIFTLSKYHPVGIMVYGSASFMNVPWETIIKIYREQISKKGFDTIEEYADNFVSFLRDENELFPESEQDRYFKITIHSYFNYIAKEIRERLGEIRNKKDEVLEKEIKEMISKITERHYYIWKNAKPIVSIPRNYTKALRDKYDAIIDKAKEDVFGKITKKLSERLTVIAVNLFIKFPEGTPTFGSGIVIAGFGARNIFPSLQSLLIEGVTNSCLKYKKDRRIDISFQNRAAIVPFAQNEMVVAFMEGVEPNYKKEIEGCLSEIFVQYPRILVDTIAKLDDDEKGELKEKLAKISSKILDKYKQRLEKYRRENYVEPVVNVVASLPKDELAGMAESLINLTSFKRKVSMQAETVGGPIDVAVISKGDGFIWIKRKHYFERESNPQFFANYYREVENEERE